MTICCDCGRWFWPGMGTCPGRAPQSQAEYLANVACTHNGPACAKCGKGELRGDRRRRVIREPKR